VRIASLLLSAPQHLSAEQILESLRGAGARVSKATVYNTLNLFAERGLIRQLSVDGSRAWFDSNVDAHYHFHDMTTGALIDVPIPDVEFSRLPPPPPGTEVAGIDIVIRLRRKS
jgi:Fur family iron response transcriptional regulator